MMSLTSGSVTRAATRWPSLLMASCLARAAVALVGVAAIWLATGWALGWW